MVFAFLVVLLSALITTPVLLYGLGLAAHGWRWQHGALFRRARARADLRGAAARVHVAPGTPVRLAPGTAGCTLQSFVAPFLSSAADCLLHFSLCLLRGTCMAPYGSIWLQPCQPRLPLCSAMLVPPGLTAQPPPSIHAQGAPFVSSSSLVQRHAGLHRCASHHSCAAPCRRP